MFDPIDRISECAGCDLWRPLDHIGLCAECAAKLDRDMIRERAWARSATAFFHYDPKDYEGLREKVITEYGAAYELIAPQKDTGQKRRKHKKGSLKQYGVARRTSS